MMYKALVQAVLMYERESWALKGVMIMVLEGFHHRIARRITVMIARKGNSNEWELASLDEVL